MSCPARAASCSNAAAPFALLRSSVTERRPRNIRSYFRSRATPSCGSKGRSTSRTSAPMSASSMPQNGTGPIDSSSSTLTPASGPVDALTPPRLARLRDSSVGTRRFAWCVPVLQQRESDREERRPQEQADEAERDDATEHTQQNEYERKVAAAADDQRLDHVVDAANDRDAPDQHEHGPARRTVVEKPYRHGNPHERWADRHRREDESCETEQRSSGNASNPESDRRHDALCDRGADDPVDDAAHRDVCHADEMLATLAGDAADRLTESRRQDLAVAIEEESDQYRQGELQQPLRERPATREREAAQRLEIFFQLGEKRRAVVREARPVVLDQFADQRNLTNPCRRLGRAFLDEFFTEVEQLSGILGERHADDHERCQENDGDQGRHEQSGE